MSEILIAQTDTADKVVGQRAIVEEGSVANAQSQDLSISGGASFVYALAAIGLLAIGVWAAKQFLAKPPKAPLSVTLKPKKK